MRRTQLNKETEHIRSVKVSVRGWEDNIKMDLQEVGCGGMDVIDLAHDRATCMALVNAVMNLRAP